MVGCHRWRRCHRWWVDVVGAARWVARVCKGSSRGLTAAAILLLLVGGGKFEWFTVGDLVVDGASWRLVNITGEGFGV